MTLKTIAYVVRTGAGAFRGHHTCPGLAKCLDHPRWHVWWDETRGWWVNPPGGDFRKAVTTHATQQDAFRYALEEATR